VGEQPTWELTLSGPHPQSESLVMLRLRWLCLLSSDVQFARSPIDRKCWACEGRKPRKETRSVCVWVTLNERGTVGVIVGGCKFFSCRFLYLTPLLSVFTGALHNFRACSARSARVVHLRSLALLINKLGSFWRQSFGRHFWQREVIR
jgi:hypothetical protein